MNDKYLTESLDILKREFGQPLPTLEDTMKAHKIKKEGGPGSGPQKGVKQKKTDDYESDSGSGGWKQKNRKKSHSGSGGWKQNKAPGWDKLHVYDEGGPGSGRKPEPGSAKDIEKKMSKAADDANAKMDRDEKEMERKAKEQAKKDMEKEFDFDFDESINERLSSSELKLFTIVGVRMMKRAGWYGKRYNRQLAETIRRILGGMQYIDNLSDAPKKDQFFLKKGMKYYPTRKYSKRALQGMGKAFSKMPLNQQKNFVEYLINQGLSKEQTFESLLKENPAAVAAATAAMVQMKAKNPQSGRVNKMSTALSNKSHPQHQKAKGIFAKLVDKFKKKKKDKPVDKAAQYRALMQKELKEGPDDVRFARRALSKVVKSEKSLRKAMMDLEQSFLRDPRPENKKLAKEIKKSYKDGVTKFMRDSVQMIKRMK
tara:strand:+ start:2198 stop:3478 length:1281 start_codon:yes stop_codon:yes gene_type:complete